MRSRQVYLLLVAILFCTCSGFAQSPAGRAFSSYHPFEVAATYTHVLTDDTYVGVPTLNGWTVSASAPVLPLIKATAQVGDYYGGHTSMKSFLVGPQLGFRVYRFEPFIRGLFGISHTSGSTPFTIAAGGGLNMPITDHVTLRLLDMDWYGLHGGGASNGADYLRVSFGVAYEFGSR
jgi:hypothetical protein